MSYFQATTYKPHGGLTVDKPVAGLGRTCKLLRGHSLCPLSSRSCKLQEQIYPRVLVAACHKRLGPVYASSGKESHDLVNEKINENGKNYLPTTSSWQCLPINKAGISIRLYPVDSPLRPRRPPLPVPVFDPPFSMESLNKAMAGAKKQRSIQNFLLEQMAKIRGQGSGGNGGKNRYGGSGGGSDGPEDESFKESLYEMVQILLATVAFILMYVHIIRGEELYRLARDYTRYLVTGKRTARLKRAMLNWRDFSEGISKMDSAQEDSYERPIASEPMWWQQPQKFLDRIEELCRGYWRPHTQES